MSVDFRLVGAVRLKFYVYFNVTLSSVVKSVYNGLFPFPSMLYRFHESSYNQH